jgi:hypothetical protein
MYNAEIKLMLAATFCLAFLGWGTVYVLRTVTDRNYHAPTAQQIRVKAFEDCSQGAYGDANKECKELTK